MLQLHELEKQLKNEQNTKNSLSEQIKSLEYEKNMLVNAAIVKAQALEEFIEQAQNQNEVDQLLNEDT